MAISDKNSNDLFRESNLSTLVDKGCSESNNVKKSLFHIGITWHFHFQSLIKEIVFIFYIKIGAIRRQ